MQPGDRFTVFNGRGSEALVELVSAKRDRVELKVLQQTRSDRLLCEITLAQAIPKGKNMDLIIEKATELGASMVAPLISERTVVQLDPDEATRKQEKWQRVAIEAAKQCGQNTLPTIGYPRSTREFLAQPVVCDLMLIASLQPGAVHLKEIVAEFGARRPSRVMVMVGPEGDFTPAEMALARSVGCRPVTLGPIILRSETAAIYCLSVLSHELFSPR